MSPVEIGTCRFELARPELQRRTPEIKIRSAIGFRDEQELINRIRRQQRLIMERPLNSIARAYIDLKLWRLPLDGDRLLAGAHHQCP